MYINTITVNLEMFRSDVLGICPDSKIEKRWNINEVINYTDRLGLKTLLIKVVIMELRGRVHKFPAWPAWEGDRNETTLLFFNIISLYFNTLFTSVNLHLYALQKVLWIFICKMCHHSAFDLLIIIKFPTPKIFL